MSQLTVFSAPKPFTDPHINIIQRNAIQSWTHIGSDVEVILVGDEPGLSETAAEFPVKHLPDVIRNEKGTPLVSSIFNLVQEASTSPVLVYVNADIILLPDILDAAVRVAELENEFLVVGQRWDLDLKVEFDYSQEWEERLRGEVLERGSLHLPAGSDYFIFPRDQFTNMPNFAIGRAGWDNWMIYHARKNNWKVVDGTPSIFVIHQDHDYAHLPGGATHYGLDESKNNEDMAGGSANLYMVLDSHVQLRDGALKAPKPSLVRLLRKGEIWLTPGDGSRQGLRWSGARQLRRMRRRVTGSLQ